jgi:DNA-binding CsgD family transcriptional regulator
VQEQFVGRTTELAELHRQFGIAAAGQGRVVILTGPPGIGKTALIRHCLREWEASAQGLLTSGDETEVTMLGGLLGQLLPLASAATSDLADVLAGAHGDPLSAGSALLAVLVQRATAKPLVLVIDDAQWADELSLRALSFAVRRLAADPVLCVLAFRSDGLARLPPGLARVAAERGARLDVEGLDAAEVAALAQLAGAGQLSDRAAERLREHTAGIPLHIQALLHDLPGETLHMPGVSLPAPRSLRTLVVSRLAACAVETEALVVGAAVLGAECELADAAALAGLADPLPALQEAASQQLLTEAPPAPRRRCAFPHALIRAAVYQDIGISRRAELHRAAAKLTSGVSALAHQVAGCPGSDARLAEQLAARAATERAHGQLVQAAEHLLMATQVADDGTRASAWLLEAVGLLIDHGDVARARGYSHQIAAMPPSTQSSLVLGRLGLLAGAFSAAEGQISKAWSGLDREPGREQARDNAAKAACELALALIGQDRLADAASWAERSAHVAASAFARSCARCVEGVSMALVGQAAQARTVLATELRECTDDPSRALLHAGLAAVLLYADDLPGAAEHLKAATASGDAARLPMTHLLEARLVEVAHAYRSGEWNQAADVGERLIRLIDDLDQGWLLGRAHLAATYVAAGRGDWQIALSHADAAARQADSRPVALADAQTAIAVAQDDPAAVLVAAGPVILNLTALSRLEPGRLSFWPAYAQALARTGRPAEADLTLRPYEQRAEECSRPSALAAACRARGVLQACLHHPEEALDCFNAALAHLSGLGMPFEEAITQLERGRLLRRLGHRRAAARDIGAARVLFTALQAQPFLIRCDEELSGGPLLAPGPAALPLTPRQLAVARAAATGKSNRQIAAELYISVKTVEFHLGQILARLNLDSRDQIASALPERGVG